MPYVAAAARIWANSEFEGLRVQLLEDSTVTIKSVS